MPMREERLYRAIIKFIQKQGWVVVKYKPGRRGMPDLIACIDGKTVLIETKTVNGRLTQSQRVEIWRWRRAGAHVGVAFSVDDAVRIINNISSKACPACGQALSPDELAPPLSLIPLRCSKHGIVLYVDEEGVYAE